MAPPTITFTDGAFLKCTTEAIAYGISVVLSLRALKLLLRRRSGGITGSKVMLCVTIALLVLSTMHIVAVIQYLRQGLILSSNPTAYFIRITTPIKVVEQSARITAVSLADALTVWRLWGVWNWKKSVIVVPCITLIGTVVCAVGFVTDQNLIKQRAGVSIYTTPSVLDWTVLFLACSLATTWYCTALIAWKLVKADNLQDRFSLSSMRRRWRKLLRILVESAALYSGTNMVYMVLYLEQTNAEAMLSAWEVPVASITFSLIIIRVNTLSSSEAEHTTQYNADVLSTVAVVNQPSTILSKPSFNGLVLIQTDSTNDQV